MNEQNESGFDNYGMYAEPQQDAAPAKPTAPEKSLVVPAMKLYLIRNARGQYFNWSNGPDPWGSLSEACIYRNSIDAGKDAHSFGPLAEVVEIDLLAPIRILRELFETGDLEDHFYHIRETECLGWEGPKLVRWGKAVEVAKKLMENL
jgi:hypothetical protein